MTLPIASFVGCGRLGQTMAKLWHDKAIFQIQHLLTRSEQSAQEAQSFIGAGEPVSSIDDLTVTDWLCIATGDDMLTQVVEQLVASQCIQPGTRVVHFSGCLSSEILSPLRERGCYVASLHPALSFAKPALAYKQFPETYCVIEGDDCAVSELSLFVEAIGGQVITMDPSYKATYHAACSFPGNFVYTLIDQAASLFEKAGFSRFHARQLGTSILSGVAFNLANAPDEPLLTGPIGRGDIETVRLHIEALRGTPYAETYHVLASKVVESAPLSGESKQSLLTILDTLHDD